MNRFLSEKVKTIKPSGIRKFFDIVLEMKDAISLGVGEPDFITPWTIRDAAIKSIKKGYTQYSSNSGLASLRDEICDYLKIRFNLSYKKEETVVTVGASEAIDITLRAILNDKDEVLIPDPSYVSYAPGVILSGGVPVGIACSAENDFKITPEMIEKSITSKTKCLILPYPNNPTGAILEKEYLEKIVEVVKKYDLIVVADEIYAELTYGNTHVSIASFEGMKERTVLISGFSKAFAMTGWRVGYVVSEKEIIDAILKIHQYVIMCAPTVSQYAALHALEEGKKDGYLSIKEMHDEYDKRRRFMVRTFNDMGLKCFEPKGAFYVFPCVESTGLSGEEFAIKLLEQEKVAVVPGNAFGVSGEKFIRCSYAYSMKNLIEATDRISNFLKSLKV